MATSNEVGSGQTENKCGDVIGRKFHDISNEYWRDYSFVRDGAIVVLRIEEPRFLHVSESGGHRIVKKNHECVYVPTGWFSLKFQVREGTEFFRV